MIKMKLDILIKQGRIFKLYFSKLNELLLLKHAYKFLRYWNGAWIKKGWETLIYPYHACCLSSEATLYPYVFYISMCHAINFITILLIFVILLLLFYQ